MKTVQFLTLFFGTFFFLTAQKSTEEKTTQDLSFLIGEWNIVRVNSPETDNERKTTGTLICEESLDGQFIKCRYEMQRPGKIRALDEVYFNYNSIYGLYESMWLSSTWPIKVLLQGTLERNGAQHTLNTQAQFEIQNTITEFVRDNLVTQVDGQGSYSFIRKTHIRTSNDEEGVWHYHLKEIAKRKK